MKHYRFTNTEIIMNTNAHGLTYQEWIDVVDQILHNHFGLTHVAIDHDWEYDWGEAEAPFRTIEGVMSVQMPNTWAAHTHAHYPE